jgi:hypothetical protein
MAIDTIKYPTPVTVNGFKCADCNEVDRAAAHIDPAHPRSGAYDVTAPEDPTRSEADKTRIAKQHAAFVPAYGADASHASGTSVIGLTIDRTA